MKYGPFPMLTTLGHMFPHMELTLRPCMVSLDEYLARTCIIYMTYIFIEIFQQHSVIDISELRIIQ